MKRLRFILSAALIMVSTFIYAQNINEAGEAFNNGTGFLKAKKYALAIEEYSSCIEMCNDVGDDAYDLMKKAKSSLNIAYIGLGKAHYKAKKFDDALAAFNQVYESSLDDEKRDKAKSYIARVYNSKGLASYKAKKYEEAIANFDKSIKFDKTYLKAIFGKAIVYKKQVNVDLFKQMVDMLIEKGPATNKTVAKTVKMAKDFFRVEGGKAIQGGNLKLAINYLNTGFEYGPAKAKAYYFAAIAYNGLSQWSKAIKNANKAISLEKKNKSNIYFELGKAYEGLGKKAQAISSYKKVINGPNAEAAKHKITVELK
jgi:tetratricopeptide (TPR) repeat protein